jgi:hypothetical protein
MSTDALRQLLADYYRDFSTLNVQSILPYFHEPSLLIGPQGVMPVPDRAAVAAAFGPVMEGLRAKGYGRSEFELGSAQVLSASAAIVGGAAARYKKDGQLLERVGITYVLHKSDGEWKFAAVILHDPQA